MFPVETPALSGSLLWLVFSEGFLTFVSPCILPMLPVYLIYLSGENGVSRRRLLLNTLGFIAGFSIIFILLGATASGLGRLLHAHQALLARVSGAVMILFGVNFLGIIKIPFLNRSVNPELKKRDLRFFSSLLFGAAFSFGWTPCLGAFLGSALMLASQTATLWHGVLLLFVFSLGLGVPFFLTALLWNRLKGVIGFVKRHFRTIRVVSGILLILVGVMMLFDLFKFYLRLWS